MCVSIVMMLILHAEIIYLLHVIRGYFVNQASNAALRIDPYHLVRRSVVPCSLLVPGCISCSERACRCR